MGGNQEPDVGLRGVAGDLDHGHVAHCCRCGLIPLALLIGLCFAAVGLIMTALAPSYDFFMYYFTLVITPMMMLSGVFFPVDQLPSALQIVSALLPLTHAIDLARPLLNGVVPGNIALHIAVILAIRWSDSMCRWCCSVAVFRDNDILKQARRISASCNFPFMQ